MILILLIITITVSPIFAQCPNSVRLKKGDKVSDCERIGYSLEYDKRVREELIEGDYNKKIIVEERKLNLRMKDLIKLEKDENLVLRTEVKRVRTDSDKKSSGSNTSFFLGVGFTLLAVGVVGYALGQVK